MKFTIMSRSLQIVLFIVVVGLASAKPTILQHLVVPAHLSSQYHAQDVLGQYSYGYADGLSSKNEVKTYDGVTRGGYSYVDSNGIVQSATYTADAVNGFKISATNLPAAPKTAPVEVPEPVKDTPEVAAAKSAHKVAHDAAAAAAAAVPEVPVVVNTPIVYSAFAPSAGSFTYSTHAGVPAFTAYSAVTPVLVNGVPADTPEVAAAKVAHFAAHVKAKQQHFV